MTSSLTKSLNPIVLADQLTRENNPIQARALSNKACSEAFRDIHKTLLASIKKSMGA
jgi:hypothetical protein